VTARIYCIKAERAKRQPADLWSLYIAFLFSFWRM